MQSLSCTHMLVEMSYFVVNRPLQIMTLLNEQRPAVQALGADLLASYIRAQVWSRNRVGNNGIMYIDGFAIIFHHFHDLSTLSSAIRLRWRIRFQLWSSSWGALCACCWAGPPGQGDPSRCLGVKGQQMRRPKWPAC